MKFTLLRLTLGLATFASLLTLVNCKKKSDPNPAPVISSFSPASGVVGTTVTITGSHFATTAADNVVKFNGTIASVTSSTATQIVTTVPAGASTGKITVSAHGSEGSSTDDFILQPILDSFSPSSGAYGDGIVILGANFSTTPADNVVKFNGTVADVNAATDTQLVVTVPDLATSGEISVTISGITVTSLTDFTIYYPPTITFFDPGFYQTGTTLPVITVTGTNFSTTPSDNVVKFNGIGTTVTTATASQLTMTLPAGVTTGKVTVTVHNQTATSVNDFLVGCPDLIIVDVTVSGIVGNEFTVTYHVKNIGTIPMDISKMYLQAYVGTTASTSSGTYQAAGGFADYGAGTLLQPNETREIVQNSVNGPDNSISTYPYVILDVLSDIGGPVECTNTVNELGTKIQP